MVVVEWSLCVCVRASFVDRVVLWDYVMTSNAVNESYDGKVWLNEFESCWRFSGPSLYRIDGWFCRMKSFLWKMVLKRGFQCTQDSLQTTETSSLIVHGAYVAYKNTVETSYLFPFFEMGAYNFSPSFRSST